MELLSDAIKAIPAFIWALRAKGFTMIHEIMYEGEFRDETTSKGELSWSYFTRELFMWPECRYKSATDSV